MFRRHQQQHPGTPEDLSPPTVRLLRSDEELRSALERAREFERRGIEECRRRVGLYDRLLEQREVGCTTGQFAAASDVA